MERSCDSCRHNLGGGYDNCRINLEAECAAGEYEAWERKIKTTEDEISAINLLITIQPAQFMKSMKKVIRSLQRLKTAMLKARGMIKPRKPRKVQIRRAMAMMKKSNNQKEDAE